MTYRMRSPATVWHVLARGVNGCDIFADRFDRQHFMNLMGRAATEDRMEVNCFMLMTNHYHLLLSSAIDPISKFMQRINGAYARKFNKHWDRYGPLYQGRFLAVPIVHPIRVIETSCYMHQNPVTALITQLPEEHEWSSYKYFLDPSLPGRPPWLRPEPILEAIPVVTKGTRRNYAELMATYRGDERDSWIEDLVRDAEAYLLT